ncbi:MAG: hypothetical protein RJB13_1907 [Pseudomonadota bacterium]
MSEPIKLGYRIFRFRGEGPAPNFPVVLLRGLGRSSGFWLEFTEKLAQHREVICIDLLGTGLSRSTFGRARITDFARDVTYTLQLLGLARVDLVGISLGGMVAVEVAASSERVNRLAVFASSSLGHGQARIYPKALMRLLWSLRKKTPSNAELAPYLVSSATLKQRPELPKAWDDLWRQEGFSHIPVLRQLFAAALFQGKASIAKLDIPILFMASKGDSLVPWQNTVKLWESAKFGQLVLLENYGHDFPTEAPDEVIQHLETFLSDAHLK